jgi:hypothetical protein
MLANIVIIFSSTKEEEDVKRVEELSSSVCCQMEANAAEWISLSIINKSYPLRKPEVVF